MKKIVLKVVSVFAAVLLLCMALAGCTVPQENTPPAAEALPVPAVAVGNDGLAVWSEVEHAIYYVYVVDGGAEVPTFERNLQLSDGQSLKVKAVSGDERYTDSGFSAPVTYRKQVIDEDHTHSDVNSDGVCDICSESVLCELSFYAVNDLHGKFMDTSSQPGVDELTTYMKQLYADDAREEILLSSGDMWQGTVESSDNRGRLMTEWMNEAGFVSMTLGNHEYDWGPDVLLPNSELAEFPFLAINVTFQGAPVAYCKPSAVVERGGVKIGIIGAIGDCLGSISGEFSQGLSFATGNALTTLVKDESQRLREEENCDFIVYSIHDGGDDFSASGVNHVNNSELPYYDTALSEGYVDLVFEAHTHQRYILQDEYGVYHLQGGGENKAVSCAEVSFNTVTKEYTVTPKHILSSVYGSANIADDPFVEEVYEKYFPDSDPYTTVLGRNARQRDSGTVCSLLAQLYYERGRAEWESEYEIVLGGGYLNTRSPYSLSAGNVTYATLYSLLPFDNAIVLGRISGRDLKSKFLNTTSSSYHIYSELSSSDVSDGAYYYIIVDTYTAYYKRNNITEVDRLGNVYARDLLADYIKAGNWAK